MGMAMILLKSGQTMICERGEGLDDKEAADAFLREVIEKSRVVPSETENSFVRSENGGGFDAKEVSGVTVPPKPPDPEAITGTGKMG